MAALGKIRSKGVILICIIGFGLFAFIAEEAFRSCETTNNDRRQQIGEVLGEKINYQDFQKIVEEYTEAMKIRYQRDNFTDDELNSIRDQVWQEYVSNKVIASEAAKVGLTVTDQELRNVLTQGTNQLLLQTPFVNQQTGRFDVTVLDKFMSDYNKAKTANPQVAQQAESTYKYWMFIEKTLRNTLLSQKYQSLLAHCLISNPVEAKMAYTDENEESNIQLASLPYSSINDNKVQISESDLKAKYDELKGAFKQPVESRDIKYVSVHVSASAADRAALGKQFAQYAEQIKTAEDPASVVRKSASLVPYLGLPVSKNAFPQDIAARLDSMSVGQTLGPVENKDDNTLNIIRLIAKTELPDSVQFRQIQVAGDKAKQTADSIYNALKAGGDFEAIARKYGQTGEKIWFTNQMYEQSQSIDKDNKAFVNALLTSGVNATQNLAMTQGNVILQVVDRRDMTAKYTAAVIKKTIDFSKETYNAAYNQFSQFLSENTTIDAIEKNAVKKGYNVLTGNDITTSQHYVGGVRGTREVLKWIFQAKEGEVSPLYDCGDNDNMMVVSLTKIHPQGYRSLDDPQVKEIIKREVMKDKKAEMLIAKLNGVNSIAAAKAKGANISTVNQVTFASPAFVSATGSSEPALSGAVAATAKGKFSSHAVKGNAGVYMLQVTSKSMRPVKYNEKEYIQKMRQQSLQYASNFMQDLLLKANVVDNRYLFF
ncbi:MAG: SurA N-terminal domain-containing protein [Prevotella sp.]|nr:SurA N-terminal domain-containing protein [Prevotella sp.]MDD7046192.1 SurA N-terminal domain-containing protein [Prevotella sp.]MDY5545930.1 peptidylprolyl isomerase [Prevotella sp.]